MAPRKTKTKRPGADAQKQNATTKRPKASIRKQNEEQNITGFALQDKTKHEESHQSKTKRKNKPLVAYDVVARYTIV